MCFFDYLNKDAANTDAIVDPAKTGVIAFVGKDDRVMHLVRSDTGTTDLRTGLDQLR